jgi:hypothetical protein
MEALRSNSSEVLDILLDTGMDRDQAAAFLAELPLDQRSNKAVEQAPTLILLFQHKHVAKKNII